MINEAILFLAVTHFEVASTNLFLFCLTHLLLNRYSVDPFLKKEWYQLVAPSMFSVKNCGKTLITKTKGTKIVSVE